MDNPIIFISWSGIQSKKVAYVIKSVLAKIYQLETDEVFVSDENLHGPHWDKQIFKYASTAHIGITCLTKENYPEPWILAEYGAMHVSGSACPILFNFPYNQLPDKYVLFKKEMCRSPFKENTKELTSVDFENLLIHLLIDVDSRGCHKRFRSKNFKISDNIRNDKRWSPIIAKAGAELLDIYKKFNNYEFFISRPINRINNDIRNEIDAVINTLKASYPDYIFASQGYIEPDLVQIRLENISKCKHFIFIYPEVANSDTPSSCLLELGAAMALQKEIFFCIQKSSDDKLPAFVMEWRNYNKSNDYIFHSASELSEKLKNIINRAL